MALFYEETMKILGVDPVVKSSWESRFLSKIGPHDDEHECWLWLGSLDRDGYGSFWLSQRTLRAHRVAYAMSNGPIPDGLVIDHLCKVRSCVNPGHMRTCTNGENVLAENSQSFQAKNSRKTHCPKGHPYFGDNLYTQTSGRLHRHCRACRRERTRARRALLSMATS